MTATTDQPNHQYNVMWLTWTNQQYYLLQRTLFSHFTNTLRQFLWNVLHFVFQFIHIFWHWKQKEIADLTFYENALKRAFACVSWKGTYIRPWKNGINVFWFQWSDMIVFVSKRNLWKNDGFWQSIIKIHVSKIKLCSKK